ncbi:MAG: PDZ domain-containing protein [Acidobacteriota bacterium]|nr:PDZ domain-containing protein [Acidobacteriota bacterium]
MTNKEALRLALAATAFAVVIGGPVWADVATEEVKKVKKIVVKATADCEGEECDEHTTIVQGDQDLDMLHEMMMQECEGEDCPPAGTHKIIIKRKSGEMGEAEHDGGMCEHCAKHRMIVKHGGEAGETHKMKHHSAGHGHAECEGKDCEHARRIFVMSGEDVGGAHSGRGHGFQWFSNDGSEHHFEGMGSGGFLGVQLTELTTELRSHFRVPSDRGVMVGKVLPESSAQGAGLEVGDVVGAVNGEAVDSAAELAHAIARLDPGSSVELEIWRQGASDTVTAILGEQKVGARPHIRTIMVKCEEGDEECGIDQIADLEALGCGDGEECDVEIICEDDGCTCVVNGDDVDCDALNLPHHLSGD